MVRSVRRSVALHAVTCLRTRCGSVARMSHLGASHTAWAIGMSFQACKREEPRTLVTPLLCTATTDKLIHWTVRLAHDIMLAPRLLPGSIRCVKKPPQPPRSLDESSTVVSTVESVTTEIQCLALGDARLSLSVCDVFLDVLAVRSYKLIYVQCLHPRPRCRTVPVL